jgi:hypothetical protein
MDLRKIGCEDERLMELAQDRVHWGLGFVQAVMNLWVLLPLVQLGRSCEYCAISENVGGGAVKRNKERCKF